MKRQSTNLSLSRDKIVLSTQSDKAAAIQNILDGYEEFILDSEGMVVSTNLEAVSITGYEEWEVIGRHFSFLYLPEDIESKKFESDLNEVQKAGGRHTLTGWKMKKSHDRFWAKMKLEMLINSLGLVMGYRIVLKEATHQTTRNDRAVKERRDHHFLYQSSWAGIIRFRTDNYELVFSNAKAAELVGRPVNPGFRLSDFFAEGKKFDELTSLLRNGTTVRQFEFEVNHSGTEKKWGAIDCCYIEEEEFVEGILFDITMHKQQEIKLKTIREELDTFMYRTSHDLRAPLASILGLINLLDEDTTSDTSKKYVEMMRERLQHQDRLLRDLASLTFNNCNDPVIEQVDMANELKVLLREFHFNSKSIDTRISIDDRLPIYTDSVRLRHILRSLIANAIKYSNKKGSSQIIKISIVPGAEKTQITIEDNGEGIEDVHLIRIFNIFYKAHTSPTGSGLGLYIAKCMTDKLGGVINVQSQVGIGSKFTVVLPNIKPEKK